MRECRDVSPRECDLYKECQVCLVADERESIVSKLEPKSRYNLILDPIAELLEKKNIDYGNSYDKLRGEYGPMGFYIRIADKLSRIKQLDIAETQVKDESVEDTIRDIIGYATLELLYRQNKKEEGK